MFRLSLSLCFTIACAYPAYSVFAEDAQKKDPQRYRLSQLNGFVREDFPEQRLIPDFDRQPKLPNEKIEELSLSGVEEVTPEGVIIRTRSVDTTELISQLKNVPLDDVPIKVRSTSQLLDQVHNGASYYLKQKETENTYTIHTDRPSFRD